MASREGNNLVWGGKLQLTQQDNQHQGQDFENYHRDTSRQTGSDQRVESSARGPTLS